MIVECVADPDEPVMEMLFPAKHARNMAKALQQDIPDRDLQEEQVVPAAVDEPGEKLLERLQEKSSPQGGQE